MNVRLYSDFAFNHSSQIDSRLLIKNENEVLIYYALQGPS